MAMIVKVRSLQGEEYMITVENSQSVSQMKSHLSQKYEGLGSTDKLKLVYKGRTMQDNDFVRDYNLEDGCKVHLIFKKDNQAPQSTISNSSFPDTSLAATNITTAAKTETSSSPPIFNNDNNNTSTSCSSSISSEPKHQQQQGAKDDRKQSRFEIILRERLAKHFPPSAVEKIMAHLEQEIDADINSSSLDDLERLAKQKLNISNE